MSQPDRFGLAVGLTHSASGVFVTGGQKQGTAWGMSVLCCNTGTQSREDDCQKMLPIVGLGRGSLQGQGKETHARMLRGIILLFSVTT